MEWLGNKKEVKAYPFHLVSSHPKYRMHSQLDNWLRGLYEVTKREPMWINPKTWNTK